MTARPGQGGRGRGTRRTASPLRTISCVIREQQPHWGARRVIRRDNCAAVSPAEIEYFRVDEDITALVPHSPGRAQFTHPVLHRTALLTKQHSDSDGRCEAA